MSNETENNDGQIPESGGKKKIIIIAAIVGVLLIAIGVGAFLFMGGDSTKTEEVNTDVKPADMQLIYVTLAQPFIFNVTGDKKQRLVQVNVQLMVRGTDNETIARENLPLVEHNLLAAFSSATVEQLRTSKGQLEIRESAAELVKGAMEKVAGQPVVERVLFTGFVMQ